MKINKKRISLRIKRIFDMLASGIALIVLLPIFIIIGIFIKIDSRGPVFFVQERAGKDGEIFRAYKLRTMVDKAVGLGLGYEIAKDDNRITRVGKYLRWGIDELPQLLNVFRGEMSLVGPRPTLIEQVNRYSKEHRRRLEMKPGLTGWALINGRNKLTWPERIKLDIWYIDHWSLWLDLKILFKTIWVVIFTREGIYGKDGVTRDYEREI
ncbi:sugar transferase [Candidatus Atribacteria bacterium 1244-E10-H5-B2]|nr:MAG: sugar transferase [Candidatus Atribacteria bacterium 1244-E10-H5-B2]